MRGYFVLVLSAVILACCLLKSIIIDKLWIQHILEDCHKNLKRVKQGAKGLLQCCLEVSPDNKNLLALNFWDNTQQKY